LLVEQTIIIIAKIKFHNYAVATSPVVYTRVGSGCGEKKINGKLFLKSRRKIGGYFKYPST